MQSQDGSKKISISICAINCPLRKTTTFSSFISSLLTSGLFQEVIMQSGSALCDWAIERNPFQYMEQIGEALECFGTSEELATCLRTKSAEALISAQEGLHAIWITPMRATPIVDNEWRGDAALLPADPEILMDSGAFPNIPIMLGVTSEEGLLAYCPIRLEVGAQKFQDPEYFKQQLLPKLLFSLLDDPSEIDSISKAVLGQYLEGVDIENDTKVVISEMVNLLGDLIFYGCHWKTLEKFAMNPRLSVYSYVFSHRTPRSPSSLKLLTQGLRHEGTYHPIFDSGVAHGDELYYLFEPNGHAKGFGSRPERLTLTDERMAEMMTQIWVTFASTGYAKIIFMQFFTTTS